jgi:hypothetical protein
MKKWVLLVTPMIMMTSIVVGCEIDLRSGSDLVTGSGNLVTVEEDFSDFDEIELATAFEATISQGRNYAVLITVDDNMEEYLNAKKDGDMLKIYLDGGHSYQDTTPEVEITLPDITRLNLSGASRAGMTGFDFEHGLDFDLSGASTVSGTLTTGDVTCTASGASRLSLEGSGRDLEMEASGASTLDLGDFASRSGDIKLSGASRATVNLSGTLDADLSGASTLEYLGNPTMGDISTSGASSIQEAD